MPVRYLLKKSVVSTELFTAPTFLGFALGPTAVENMNNLAIRVLWVYYLCVHTILLCLSGPGA